jgi:hypothetical protein
MQNGLVLPAPVTVHKGTSASATSADFIELTNDQMLVAGDTAMSIGQLDCTRCSIDGELRLQGKNKVAFSIEKQPEAVELCVDVFESAYQHWVGQCEQLDDEIVRRNAGIGNGCVDDSSSDSDSDSSISAAGAGGSGIGLSITARQTVRPHWQASSATSIDATNT